jgi:hypothetical protein
MLEKWLKIHKYSKRRFAIEVGITRPTLDTILNKTAQNIHYATAIKIKMATGLYPWDYLPGYENIKGLYEKRKSRK